MFQVSVLLTRHTSGRRTRGDIDRRQKGSFLTTWPRATGHPWAAHAHRLRFPAERYHKQTSGRNPAMAIDLWGIPEVGAPVVLFERPETSCFSANRYRGWFYIRQVSLHIVSIELCSIKYPSGVPHTGFANPNINPQVVPRESIDKHEYSFTID